MANGFDLQDKGTLARVAALVVAQVPVLQIAEMFGCGVQTVWDLQRTKEFMLAISEKRAELGMEYKETNDTWDSVEKAAIGIVKDNLKWNKDVDFALKAAMVANKALRRGHLGNVPLNADGGARITINLNQQFIGQLQRIQTDAEAAGFAKTVQNTVARITHKQNDVISPKLVSEILDAPEKEGVVNVNGVELDLSELKNGH